MDAANIDLKGFSNNFYKKNCLAELEPVLETIKYVKHKTNCHLELTTLLIEEENDSNEMLKAQCNWIKNEIGSEVPLHFSAFHPAYRFLYHKPTKPETIYRAIEIANKAGIKYVYAGNIC